MVRPDMALTKNGPGDVLGEKPEKEGARKVIQEACVGLTSTVTRMS